MARRTASTAPSTASVEIELQTPSRHETTSADINIHGDDDSGALHGHAGQELEQPELKPVDRGRDAWQLLISAFIFEALFWGFPTSYGVFQAYYTGLPQFANDTSNIAVIGTLAQGLAYLGAPFSAYLTKRFPRHLKVQLIFGWSLCIAGLLTASFATSVAALIVTQGMVYGIGFIVHTYPILNMVNEWWITRKGMAFGLISAASGLTGIFMPLLLEALLHRYGYQITLRACAVAMFILTGPTIPLLRGRLPPPSAAAAAVSSLPNNNTTAYENRSHQARVKTDWSFLKNRLFYFYAAAMTTQGFGFFIPPIFLPSYAIQLTIPSTQAASLLAIMALFQTTGQFTFGWLSDRNLPVSLLASTCCVVAGSSTLLFWGAGQLLAQGHTHTNFAILILYALTYGFFAFAFSTLRVAMGRAVTKDQSAVLATYSIFVFMQGIGNVMVGPVAGALMQNKSFDPTSFGATQYKSTVIFVAVSSVLGAAFMVAPSGIDAVRRMKLR